MPQESRVRQEGQTILQQWRIFELKFAILPEMSSILPPGGPVTVGRGTGSHHLTLGDKILYNGL